MNSQAQVAPPVEDTTSFLTDNLSLAELVKQIQSSETYADVSIREEAAEVIFEAMQQRNVTRAELARRLKKSPPYVTKILSGEENLGLETLSKIFRALDCRLRLEYSITDSQNPLWTIQPTTKRSLLRRIEGGAPLNWQPMSQAQLQLVPEEEALAFS